MSGETKKLLLCILLVCAALLLSLAGCNKQPLPTPPLLTGSISGTVYQNDSCPQGGTTYYLDGTPMPTPTPFPGYPYQGAIVSAYRLGTLAAEAVSDADGRYSLTGLAPGVYELSVSYFKYEHDVTLPAITLAPGQAITGNDVTAIFDYSDDALIVCFPLGFDPALAQQLIAGCGCLVLNSLPVASWECYIVGVPDHLTLPATEACFQARPEVVYLSRDSVACVN